MKRKILVCAVLAICLSLLVFGTLAYFTAEERAHNVITSGNIDIDLQEWADENKTVPFPEDGVGDVMPGTEVTKIVEIKNTGSGAAYIRVEVEQQITLEDGSVDKSENSPLSIDFDKTNWTLGDDGYYYYNKALEPGETTEPLFTKVTFDKTMDNKYQNSTAAIDVTGYAVQTANNGNSALEAKGWAAAVKS